MFNHFGWFKIGCASFKEHLLNARPGLINLHNLTWCEYIILASSEVYFSNKFKHDGYCHIHSNTYTGKLLDITNQWSIGGSG